MSTDTKDPEAPVLPDSPLQEPQIDDAQAAEHSYVEVKTDHKSPQLIPDPAKTGQAGLTRPEDLLPNVVVALPLNQRPVFPTMNLPLVIPAGRLADAVRQAISVHGGHLAFFLTRAVLEDGAAYTAADLYPMGSIAKVVKHHDTDGGGLQVFAQVIARFRADDVAEAAPVLLLRGAAVRPTIDAADPQVRAYAMAIVTALKDLVQHNPVFGDEIKVVLANFNHIDGPGRLADVAAALTTAKREELQTVLETVEILPRMEKVLQLLAKETELSQLKTRIAHQIEEKVTEGQRKFFLNEQLKTIKEELGLESDDKSLDLKRFRAVLEKKEKILTAEVKQVITEELKKLSLLEAASSEYGVVRARLEWLCELPWGVLSNDRLDLAVLRQGLDRDHFGLEEIKNRIVEFCAVRRLKSDRGGGIIALVGPPGTGKTSIGQSVARNLGRKFFRFSLGGMRDEAEIKGHRRTYVGALPGKLVQALRRCGTMNPVIMLDEIDKLAVGLQGDSAAALLEVLDPEQNRDFLDHYLDVRVDLSQVLFIATANDLSTIPEPLRDRMGIIRLAGYVEAEKQVIARDHLVPKQRKAHGLTARDVVFTRPALAAVIRDYAREAGVRHLEQLIAKVCRKVASAKAETLPATAAAGETIAETPATDHAPGDPPPRDPPADAADDADSAPGETPAAPAAFARRTITPTVLPDYLGKPLMRDDALLDAPVPGVVTGLAWTSMGGATLEIEAVVTVTRPNGGGLTLSGQLGDVMKESANLARSYLMSHAVRLGLDAKWFSNHHVHLHVPAGATPKDGPSAGVTMASALCSLALGRAPVPRLGMTGELTLTGRVFPIGGVREKLVAAKRAGLTRVLLPAANDRDYDELPAMVKDGIDVSFVGHLDDVLRHAGLVDVQARTPAGKAKTPASKTKAAKRPARKASRRG